MAHPEAHQAELKRAASIEQINHKLFADEFFDPASRDIIVKDFKHYDLKQH
jgi:hypothetical protein